MLEKLSTTFKKFEKFHDTKQFEAYISQRSQWERLVIIVRGKLAEKIVPWIHNIQQVVSIYIYRMDKHLNNQWLGQFSKVKLLPINSILFHIIYCFLGESCY